MALSNEDRADVKRSLGAKAASAVSRVTNDSHNRLSGYQKDQLRKRFGTNRLSGHQLDIGRKAARTKAIHAKMADEINSRNKANPKKYKAYLRDSHNHAAGPYGHLSEN